MEAKMNSVEAYERAVHLGMELHPVDKEKRRAYIKRKKIELLKRGR